MFRDWLEKRGLLKPATQYELYSFSIYVMYAVLIVVGLFLFFGKPLYLAEFINKKAIADDSAIPDKRVNAFTLVGSDSAQNGYCFKREAVVSGSTSISEYNSICSADVTFICDKSLGIPYGPYLICSFMSKDWQKWDINYKDRRIVELGESDEKPSSGYRPYVRVSGKKRYGILSRHGKYVIIEVEHVPEKRNLLGGVVQYESVIMGLNK